MIGVVVIELPVDALLRLSAIIGIFMALATLFDEQGMLDRLEAPNDALWCSGRRPKYVIRSGEIGGLIACRRHFDALRTC
jgi:hypothetical protein